METTEDGKINISFDNAPNGFTSFGKPLSGFEIAGGDQFFYPAEVVINRDKTISVWSKVKKYRIIRASLEGINAAASGMVIAAAIILFDPLPTNAVNIGLVLVTYGLLAFTKIPAPLLILGGLLLGLIF